MKYNKMLAGILLAMASVSASAANVAVIAVAPTVNTQTITLDDTNTTFGANYGFGNAGKSFIEIFNFTISGTSTLGSSVFSTITKGRNLDITSFGLYLGNTLLSAGTMQSTGAVENWTLDAFMPVAGNYSMRVGVNVIGNSNVAFVGTGYVTAVPEPEGWAMLIGGLGVVGFLARRRKSSATAPALLPA